MAGRLLNTEMPICRIFLSYNMARTAIISRCGVKFLPKSSEKSPIRPFPYGIPPRPRKSVFGAKNKIVRQGFRGSRRENPVGGRSKRDYTGGRVSAPASGFLRRALRSQQAKAEGEENPSSKAISLWRIPHFSAAAVKLSLTRLM